MGRGGYSLEVKFQAEELYVYEGQTYKQVAAATGVSVTQVQRWAADDGWQAKREELRRTLAEKKRERLKLEVQIQELQVELIKTAIKTRDPQIIYAFARLEGVAAKTGRRDEAAAPDIDRPRLFLEYIEFIAGVLKETDPEGLKVLARNFEMLVARFKAAQDKAAA